MTRAKRARAPADRRASPAADRLGLYRLLASFPLLATYRAKVVAVVAAGFFVPAFVLALVAVLAAGRLGVLPLVGLVAVLAFAGAFFVVRALDRLLVPLDLAERAIDDLAFGRAVARTDLPGTDSAVQVLRGVQALAQRVERDGRELRERGQRDELTGLCTRAAGRERAQQLIDRETRRGRRVRVLVADVDGFTAFNAAHGSGHGDAMLKVIASRLARIAGDEGVAMRWGGDAFALVQAGPPDDMPPARELLARPIVVKGLETPLQLAFGSVEADARAPFDQLAARAEAALAGGRLSGAASDGA